MTTATSTSSSCHAHRNKRFINREQAGRDLAERLSTFARRANVVVVALPKGGVTVGAEVAKALGKPFDVFLVGEIIVAEHRDKPLGAITGGGVRMLNSALIDRLHVTDTALNAAILKKAIELAQLERSYRGQLPSLNVADNTVILVDDGSLPCATLSSAVRLLRRQHADQVIVAVPAPCKDSACELRLEADDVVTLAEPETVARTGKWFRHFPRTTDTQVRQLVSDSCRSH